MSNKTRNSDKSIPNGKSTKLEKDFDEVDLIFRSLKAQKFEEVEVDNSIQGRFAQILDQTIQERRVKFQDMVKEVSQSGDSDDDDVYLSSSHLDLLETVRSSCVPGGET
eukprot:CAMPEP_0114978816 /NCGR_PEP_ID=MMETSP0216-20121206/4024_1 /TAXON_ID=223996 /ORGANISM="Protocruzia adherens, Strain Boccale" /LENGTH=108 /DNA_ID=CAMNT_0002340069 /DNA_START=181 /DNA_END=503 /DNA_ORIENTATION=+